MALEKVVTGIPGVDEMLGGGLPKGSVSIISGSPGVGKSSFAMQFLLNGIAQGEAGVYLTVEESRDEVIEYASAFGWDLKKYESEGKLAIVAQSVTGTRGNETSETLGDKVKELNAKRIAFDSVTLFKYLFRDETARRVNLLNFMREVKKHDCTTLMISEMRTANREIQFNDEHFLADGLLLLFWSTYREKQERCFRIVKMRGCEIIPDVRPMDITSNGIVVYPTQVPLSLADK